MKALIKGGLVVALGWLAGRADGQEFQRWSTPKNASGIVPVSAQSSPVSLGRPVGLGRPVRQQDHEVAPASFQRIIRGQSGDDALQPLPKIEVLPHDKPKTVMPKAGETFVPPLPTPIAQYPGTHIPGTPMPGPVWDTFGAIDGCGSDGGACCGPRWGGGRSVFFGDNGCCPDRGRAWFNAEYLLWFQRAQVVPPLVTASPITTTPTAIGILGQSSTTILYDETPNRTRGGGRFTIGSWLPRCENLGVELNYFFIGRQAETSVYGPSTTLALARPFFSSSLRANNAEVFNSLDRTGSATVSNYSQLWGMEGNLRYKWRCGPNYWIDLLAGYRHLNLSEGIDITEDLTLNTTGLRVFERESFRTRNMFNGGQVGIDAQWRLGNRFFAGLTTKVAFGSVYQIVNIDGSTTLTLPGGATETQRGALLALEGTNIGQHTQHKFAVLPEVGVRLGYDVTDNLQLYVGYNFLYLSNVVRPGDQIDLRSNPNFRPFTGRSMVGDRVPAVLMQTSEYWAQGLTFGMQYRW